MKLTYWKVQCKNDNNIYSIRAKTKKDAIEQFKEDESPSSFMELDEDFARVEKIVIYYSDAFDLMEQLLSEGSPDFYIKSEYIIK